MAAPIRVNSVEYAERTTRPRDATIRRAAQTPGAQNRASQLTSRQRDTARPTVDEIFLDSYAQKGLQPSIGGVGGLIRPQVEYRQPSNESLRRRQSRETLREHPQVSTLMRQTPGEIVDRIVEEGEEFAEYLLSIASEKSGLRQVVGGALTALAYIKVTRVNLMILPWTVWLWLWIQLPFALISLGFLGIAGALDALKTQFQGNPVGDFLVWAAEKISGAVVGTTKALTGLDLSLLDPTTVFFITHSIAFLVGISTLFLIGIIYLISFFHPLFGKDGTTLKTATFIIALCGCVFPFLNIFPWFLFWILAVWRYPK